ncbi:hypothetical protein HYS96_01185 [Candidatus Daviesbacteria bacterium]|nr:hypothetical protein [Candidatus Daviesbacteria bacterium]
MKLLLLHGPGKTGSRTKLINIKKGFDPSNIVVFEEGVDLGVVEDNLVSTSLFSEERLVILENPPEDFTPYTLNRSPYTLVFWFDHEASDNKPITEWVKKERGEILYFPESKEVSVFPFLDLLAVKDNKAFLEMKKLKDSGYDVFYFITMVFYLLRNLVYTPKSAKDFVRKKNAKMRTNFSQQELVYLYKFVLETEFKIKSGLMELAQAEFLLVNKFME